MSDDGLNKVVATLEGFGMDNGYGFIDSNGNVVCYDIICPRDEEPYCTEVRKNYCNNWADMGPMIHKEKIILIFDPLTKLWFATTVFNSWLNEEPRFNANPLRAAAIAYILAKQEGY